MRQAGAIMQAFADAESTEPARRYVETDAIKRAVGGHETQVLSALGIHWTGTARRSDCPFPRHGGKSDWRWDSKSNKAFCTCGSEDIFGCVVECRGVDFGEAKLFVAETIGRHDLIKTTKQKNDAETKLSASVRRIQRTDAASLLSPHIDNRDDTLVSNYLAARLGVDVAEVPMPATPSVGIKSLGYFDPPEVEGGKPVKIGEWPCAVFCTIDRDGKQHAQRIYLAHGGAGKADLGRNASGEPRDPKKSAKAAEGDNVSGRAVIWGKIETATVVILAEGIETAAALALVFAAEIAAGQYAVASGVNANGVEAFRPWDANAEIIVAADRDEAVKREGKPASRRGEKAARKFGLLRHQERRVRIAMPGEHGQSIDWLDALLAEGADAVRAAILDAAAFELSEDERGPRVEMPEGYAFTSRGLVYRDPFNDDAGDILVAGNFDVLAQTRNGDGHAWGVLLSWRDNDGRPHRVAIPRASLAGDGAEARRLLLDRGLFVAPNKKPRDLLTAFLLRVATTARAKATPRIGWHENAFLLPEQCFGAMAGDELMLQGTTAATEHAFRTSGSLEDWQHNVGRFAVGNTRLMFALSAAFAAPLVRLCDAESGGVHFKGPSSIGKSTILNAAGSVWGGGSTNYVRSWRATSNGLEGVAQGHCDALLCLDELSQLQAREAGEVAYMLGNGSGKSRASRDGSSRRAAQWTLLFLSSGEISLAEKVAEDGRGKRLAAGQQVRVLDVPADAGRGMGLFEELHGFDSPAKLAQHINSASRAYYGEPARAFLAEITQDVDAARARAREAVDAFCAAVDPNADAQVLRAARRFGLIAAGGYLAAAMKIAPWEPAEAVDAARTMFAAYVENRGGIESAEGRAIVRALRDFISANGLSRFLPAWSSDERKIEPRDLAGYRQRSEGGESERWDYYITSSAWAEIFAGMDARRAAAELQQRGYLIPSDSGRRQVSKRVPGIATMWLYHVPGSILEGGEDD